MAKRKKVQPEDRLVKIIKILKPEWKAEAIKILKSAAVMLGLPSFDHNDHNS